MKQTLSKLNRIFFTATKWNDESAYNAYNTYLFWALFPLFIVAMLFVAILSAETHKAMWASGEMFLQFASLAFIPVNCGVFIAIAMLALSFRPQRWVWRLQDVTDSPVV